MDAGIGATGGGDGGFGLVIERGGGLFEALLDRGAVGLALPADEMGAVIFEFQGEAGHARRVPAGILQPRRKSAASSGARPGRCRRVRRRASAPQAMVS